MYLNILAIDLDGTLAEHDTVAEKTWNTLRAARESGIVILLVTGRRLSELDAIGPFDQICEAIVAENGAVVYFPRNAVVSMPFGHLAPEILQPLKKSGIPLDVGMAIAATWVPHDKEVLEVIADTHYAATVEYNKGAIMVLPPGATKGSGLKTALHELGYSPHNVVGIGDAENDRSLFEQVELSVAVGNASPEIKKLADIQLTSANGVGVSNFIRDLMSGKLPVLPGLSKRSIPLGNSPVNTPLQISPIALLHGNMCIIGSSGSGKSWLAGYLVEKLLHQEYQLCIIDPEGDYRGLRAFSHTLLLGGNKVAPPPVADVITLMEYSNVSIILDLSLYSPGEQLPYVSDLLQALFSLRIRRGKPHWILLDEAHYFCPAGGNNNSLTDLITTGMKNGGLGLITFRPSHIAPAVLRLTNHWLATKMKNREELLLLQNQLEGKCQQSDIEQIMALNTGQAFVCLDKCMQRDLPPPGTVSFVHVKRMVPHIRHLHKYLRAPLPKQKQFYFHITEPYDGAVTAASLWEFSEAVPKLPVSTLIYHLERRDFERWLKDVLHDDVLSKRVRRIARRGLSGEVLRDEFSAAVSERFEELQNLI